MNFGSTDQCPPRFGLELRDRMALDLYLWGLLFEGEILGICRECCE